AINPLATAPAWNHRTAITSRNVLPAVSITPDEIARRRSNRNVRAVRSGPDINAEAPSELRREVGRVRRSPRKSRKLNTIRAAEIPCAFSYRVHPCQLRKVDPEGGSDRHVFAPGVAPVCERPRPNSPWWIFWPHRRPQTVAAPFAATRPIQVCSKNCDRTQSPVVRVQAIAAQARSAVPRQRPRLRAARPPEVSVAPLPSPSTFRLRTPRAK